MSHFSGLKSGIKFNGENLSLLGLNLQAVINLEDLPSKIINQLSAASVQFSKFTQLILIGHAGQLMWQKLHETKAIKESNHPIDDFSRYHIEAFFSEQSNIGGFELVFPTKIKSNLSISLQVLGELAGWHNPTPFGVGINSQWGSWFAYRGLVLANSHYQPSVVSKLRSPCQSCDMKPCIKHCPANALKGEKLNIKACLSYRCEIESNCKERCIARESCPVAPQHQYKIEQIKYHYTSSLKTITLD